MFLVTYRDKFAVETLRGKLFTTELITRPINLLATSLERSLTFFQQLKEKLLPCVELIAFGSCGLSQKHSTDCIMKNKTDREDS